MLSLDRIYQAAHVLKNTIKKTDLIYAPNIKEDCNLFLKPENLQVAGSFKIRGATFKMSTLSEEERARGVVCCSAGNHAQGVALAAREKGVESHIFIPSTAPISKVEATRSYGANIYLIDGIYDDAYEEARKFQEKTDAVFLHPFDDEDVIAGQGTIGLELLDQMENLEAVVVPIGGGGLISGIAYVLKNLNPNCKIYGVQAVGANSMANSLKEKKLILKERVNTFADGIAVKNPGKITYDMCMKYVDDVVTVTDDEAAAAILAMMEQQKLVSEGAGAVAVAAVMFDKLPVAGKNTVAILSGGNIDVNILSRVINRGLTKAGRISELSIDMLDKPGQLHEVSGIIADAGANVIMVNHNRSGEDTDINACTLEVTMETRSYEHLKEIEQKLVDAGYELQRKK